MHGFERPITSALVFHKTNPDVHFVVFNYDRNTDIYLCRHISSFAENSKSIIEHPFYGAELEVIDFKEYYRGWAEFEIVSHRSNPTLKLITLADLPGRGKTKCRWISSDDIGGIFINECVFEDFELVKLKLQ